MQESQTQATQGRSQIYQLLALLYSKEPSTALVNVVRDPAFVSALTELGIELDKDFLEKPEQQLVDELSEEYTQLFLGPQDHISLYGSVHRPEEGQLWGESTAAVKAFIEGTGLNYRSDFTDIPDHISVELEFMHILIEGEAAAAEAGSEEKRGNASELQRRFLEEQLSQWIPKFCDEVVEKAPGSFYSKVALLTKEFILTETGAKGDDSTI